MNPKPTTTPQVILLLPSDTTIAADMRRGILRYVHAHEPWSLRVVEGYHQQRVFCQADRTGFAGIIGRPYLQYRKFWGLSPKLSLRRGGGCGRVVEMKGGAV